MKTFILLSTLACCLLAGQPSVALDSARRPGPVVAIRSGKLAAIK